LLYRIGFALLWLSLVGCASHPSAYEILTSQATPKIWTEPNTWDFMLFGPSDESIGFVRFEFTDEGADSCAYGNLLARPLYIDTEALPLERWYRDGEIHAAYEIYGASLKIQLNAPVCDNDTVAVGVLTESGAAGQITSGSAFSSKKTLIARFEAKRASVRIPATPEDVEKGSVPISKELYDALQIDQLAVYDPSNPWPDNYLTPSESYEECANLAIPFAEYDQVFLLKALQLCERRHPTDP
jgi:hypothetical protein